MLLIIISLLILFIFILFFLKLTIEIVIGDKSYIDIKLFGYIRLRRVDFNKKEMKRVKFNTQKIAEKEIINYLKHIEYTETRLFIKDIKRFLSKVEIEKLSFDLNINTDNYILNAYAMAIVNSVIATLISKNIDMINMDNLRYNISSNENKTKLNLKCIMKGKTADIIKVGYKITNYFIKLKERGIDENGKRTSNRKFNGDSNVVTRVNG